MPNTTTSPNMNLPVPVPGTDPGPDWANNIVADMYAIDSHDHSSGKGVQITPSGININADFPQNENNITEVKTVRFQSQSAVLSGSSDVGCLYEVSDDLYYNDGAGNHVRITQSGSVAGAAGTITGLPSGTASASYAAGTFTWQSATNTPAVMSMGPVKISRNAASPKFVTLSANAAQASDYDLNFPAASPTANQILVSDGSGNFSWAYGQMPIGAVVATFPNLTGAYSCTATTAADSFGYVKCNGQTISDATSPMNGQVVPNINNTVFLSGSTTAGTSGGASSVTLITANLPSHTHGAGSYATSVGVTGGTASLTGTTIFATSGHDHDMSHYHVWGYQDGISNGRLFTLISGSSSSTSISSGSTQLFDATLTGSGLNAVVSYHGSIGSQVYTTGVLGSPGGSGATAVTGTSTSNASVGISSTAASMTGSNSVTGTSGSAGSGTSFSILPTYITALYVMRIK